MTHEFVLFVKSTLEMIGKDDKLTLLVQSVTKDYIPPYEKNASGIYPEIVRINK
jgi:hypothetical protein